MNTTKRSSRSEPLGEPEGDLDLLLRRGTNEIEIDAAVLPDREAVIEDERAELLLDLRDEITREGEPLLARGRIEAGDREALELGRGPRERNVHDPGRDVRGGEPVPDRRRPPVAAVDEPQLVAAAAALREVPDPVPARVDAGRHGRPRMRRQRMRDGAEDAARSRLEEAGQVRQLSGLDQRVDDVECRRVEAYDGEVSSGHGLSITLQREVAGALRPFGFRRPTCALSEIHQHGGVRVITIPLLFCRGTAGEAARQ